MGTKEGRKSAIKGVRYLHRHGERVRARPGSMLETRRAHAEGPSRTDPPLFFHEINIILGCYKPRRAAGVHVIRDGCQRGLVINARRAGGQI